MPTQSIWRRTRPLMRQSPTQSVARARKPLAALLTILLLFHWTVPALAQSPPTSAQDTNSAPAASVPAAPPGGAAKTAEKPVPGGGAAGGAMALAGEGEGGASPPGPFSVEAFQTDLFTGAATTAIPLVVPPGTAGATPKLVFRYNSGTVDNLGPRDQGQWTGLGWTLDTGGFILRDTKNTLSTTDDTFKLVFGGVAYDLVLVDAGQSIYHTKDETFWRLQYVASGDSWTLTTKDGTQHRFGGTDDSKARTRFSEDLSQHRIYKYLLNEVTTTSGTAVRYSYAKQEGTVSGYPYDQAVYPETITYTYRNGNPVGPLREVRFLRSPRTDWTDTSTPTTPSFFERDRVDATEVWVGTNLVRKYVFSFDYSIDRDPGYTWGGGATGDLTLTSVTLYGADGISALPSLTFTYSSSRLAGVNNGIGGMVSYSYDRIYTNPVYRVLLDPTCAWTDTAPSNDTGHPNCTQYALLLGHALATNPQGTTALYKTRYSPSDGTCRDWAASHVAGECTPGASLLGYTRDSSGSGMTPLYGGFRWACSMPPDPQWFDLCLERSVATQPLQWFPELLGYIYSGRIDRYRVLQRSLNDGRGTIASTTFNYGDFQMSSDGTEFRGHAWVRAIDPAGHYTDTWFHQDDALKGRAYQIETHRNNDQALFTKVVNTWTATNPYPGVTFAALTRMDAYTYDGDASFKQIAQTFQYDAYGNPTQVQHLGEAGISGDERTEVTEYFPNAAAYIVGLPGHAYTLDAGGATVAQIWFYYDGATSHSTPPTLGRLTKKCQWLSGGTNPCVQRTYDAYGNLLTTTEARGNTTTTTYETTYQTFPATVTTPPTPNAPTGLVSTSVYDARFGVVTSTTDPNNQTTTNQYDVFGRLTSVTNALQQTKTLSYDALGTVGSQRVTTRLQDGSPDGLWTEAYFDGLGRTFKVRKEAAAGQVILLETVFDTRGLVSQKSLPRFEGVSPLWTSFAYDALGRLTTTTLPDGTSESLAYNDWTVTATDRNGRTRTSVKDAYGRVRQLTEPGGAVTTYTYDALGRLTSVTDAASNVTTLVYDTLGRKVSMTEPNMGAWSYGYDASGNLTSQTDAKGQPVSFTYDTLNRVASKTYPGLVLVPLYRAAKSWVEGYAPLFRGGICVADGTGACIGGDVRRESGLGPAVGYLKTSPDTGTLAAYPAVCYADGGGTCTGWSLSLDVSGSAVGYLATSPPDQQSQNNPFTQSGGLLYQGLGGTPSAYLWTAPSGSSHTDHFYASETNFPPGYVSEGLTGYLRQDSGINAVPLVRYVNAATGSHYYSTGGDAPPGYTSEATLGYLETASGPDLTPLARHYNAATGDFLLDTSTTPPSGYTYQATLGYLWLQSGAPGGTVTFTYDTGTNGKGRRSTMADLAGSETYTYDALGRRSSVTRITDGVAYTTQSTYTSLGQPATVAYPDGEVVTYAYDAGGQVSAMTGSTGGTYVAGITYDAAGQVLQLTYGNGAVRTHTYQPTTLRLASLVTTKDGTTLQSFSYSYDNVGNITTLTDTRTPANTQTFTYDPLDRLESATGPYGSHSYSYNPIGNILTKAGVTYTYGATAQTCNRLMPHAVTSTSDGKSYTYDCNGNMLSDGERTLTWDADNKPVAITRTGVGTTTFAYSGDGARVKKAGPAGTIRYAGGLEDHVTDQVQVKHIMAGSLRVATRVVGGPNAGTYFTHGDHLGSLNVLTNSQGVEVQGLTYLPFGETHTNQGSVDFHQRRYTGQEQDPETGLYFYNARYYNPVLGRFLSPDSIVPGAGNPQSLNRYSYVNNNPVNFTDPTGHFLFFLPMLVGMVVGYAAAEVTGIAILGGIIGGAAAGAASTAIYGGNPAKNVLVGALLGGLGAAIASPLAGALAGPMGSEAAGAVASATVTGAVVGGVGAAIYGGNVLEGILAGAITAAAFAVAAQAAVQLAQQNESQALDDTAGEFSGGRGNPRPRQLGDPGNVRPGRFWPTESLDVNWADAFTTDHVGIDIRNCMGCDVGGMREGTVVGLRVGAKGGPDSFVQIRTGEGYHDLYSHTRPLSGMAIGQRILAGQVIGTTDLSGYRNTGPHLHYELRMPGNGPNLDPWLRLRGFFE